MKLFKNMQKAHLKNSKLKRWTNGIYCSLICFFESVQYTLVFLFFNSFFCCHLSIYHNLINEHANITHFIKFPLENAMGYT